MSTARFTKVSSRLWRSQKFAGLPDANSKLAYLFLLTSGHQTSAGAHRIPTAYACADLGWTPEEFEGAMHNLIDAELILFDEGTSEAYVLNWFSFSPPANPSHRKGIERALDGIESETIRQQALTELQEANPALHEMTEGQNIANTLNGKWNSERERLTALGIKRIPA